MKYLIGSSLFAIALALTGCNSSPIQPTKPVESTPSTPAETQVINFVGPMGLTIQLKSSDNFETAVMTDNSDRAMHLKAAIAASGVRLTSDDGVSIHFKNGEGVVELVKGRPINITEYKK